VRGTNLQINVNFLYSIVRSHTLLERAFDEYTSNYDLNNSMIKSKYNHSYRVMHLCEKYAKELGWSKSDILLARIIGLLHDFGRFEQYKVYKSFKDKETIDHADYSVEQLFDKGLITKFTRRKKDYEIIKFAIENHNKIGIPKCDDERMIRFAKLIRDADKVDIMYLLGDGNEIKEKGKDELISDEVFNCIKKHTLIPHTITNNYNDRIVVQFAFVFDLNYDVVLSDYKKNLKGFYKQVEYNNIFKDIYEEVTKYIDERMKVDVRN